MNEVDTQQLSKTMQLIEKWRSRHGTRPCSCGQGNLLREGESARVSRGGQQTKWRKEEGVFGKKKSIWQDVEERKAWLHEKPAVKVDVGWVDVGLQQVK